MAEQEPVTWCRVFGQRVCPHPCVDCKRADATLTDRERAALLGNPDDPALDGLVGPERLAAIERQDDAHRWGPS